MQDGVIKANAAGYSSISAALNGTELSIPVTVRAAEEPEHFYGILTPENEAADTNENIGQEGSGQESLGQEEPGQESLGQEDLNQEDLEQEDVNREDLDQEDIAPE